ncbi:4-carboxy-4-hydroxy-2-oxoadipate aldolase/oxaloacetate decarboxylase [Leucobacter aridicollis]|uniref:4-carboxy-4-hydroxy-2-oxoadipate aldolase/oxaloacetate decarboxylase n=1 Tax=Leucobacter aridicollis TaxID=283878 RepID=UPI000E64818C|nr:4-carboxy-4-hydroxy-2-oxoadipate aldolase/oxaloacetate decarboxylase [Leucobacter aridicollis]UTX52998.1 4-carboxy-4-hydroxy-2-oxoadipate aldolase/oxaloacetate decarboxylase [Leucobacter aridicollis]
MNHVIVTDIARADSNAIAELGELGVATVHEAMGRCGLVGPSVRPVQHGARLAGSAVTVQCWPGDNLMIHAAVEQCEPGDVLVVTTVSPSLDGSFGELFATALQRRGVRGIITSGGVRDVAELREMGFHAWAGAQNAQGTVKATGGSVNVPIVVGGAQIDAGDVIVADDDGVVCVPRAQLARVLESSRARVAREVVARAAYEQGVLSLDHNGLRPLLAELGVTYVAQQEISRGR